ncbi:unnamed protein product [Linum tenue]|uniref:Uncharacterized protein n=1 Tax=Linum tenue TaxID=586396 RepID=A0AAV0HC64_9ROSI|nr:unnamed protein product [Linum tenue]
MESESTGLSRAIALILWRKRYQRSWRSL